MDEASNSNVSAPKELIYESPAAGRLLLSSTFDLFLSFLLGCLLLLGGNALLSHLPFYEDQISQKNEIQIQSRLYVLENDGVLSLSEALSQKEGTRNEQANIYRVHLENFYLDFLSAYPNLKGEETYRTALSEAKEADQSLFNAQGDRLLLSGDYDEAYLNFYQNLYSNDALGRLASVPSYRSIQSALLLDRLLTISICFTLSFLVFYLAVPLGLKRGKKTLGMLFSHVGYVDASGLSPRPGRFLLFAAFKIVFVFLLSVVSFLIPLALSLGMMILRKDHQGLSEYLFGLYPVSCQNQRIYESKRELPKS